MIEINASRSVRIPTPYDAKSCNYYYKGDILNPSAIVVETIVEYLARVTTNLRSAGHPVTIELPKDGYDVLPEYPIGDWNTALANFDTHYYTFVGGLADENFVEILQEGHPPVTMHPDSADMGSIGDDQVLTIHKQAIVDAVANEGKETITEIIKTTIGNNHESFLIENTVNNTERVDSSWTVLPYNEQVGEFKAVVMVRDKTLNEIKTLMNILSFDYTDAVKVVNENQMLIDGAVTLNCGIDAGTHKLYATVSGMTENAKRIHLCFERCVIGVRYWNLEAETEMILEASASLTAYLNLEASADIALNFEFGLSGYNNLRGDVPFILDATAVLSAYGIVTASFTMGLNGQITLTGYKQFANASIPISLSLQAELTNAVAPIVSDYTIDDLFPSVMTIVNQEMNCYNEGTPITVVAIDTTAKTIQLDWIPEGMPISVTSPVVGKEWLVTMNIGPSYANDYSYIKITGGNPITKVLNYVDLVLGKTENFIVGAEIVYYNQFNNGFDIESTIPYVPGTYYSQMNGPGGVWRHSDGTFRMAVNGYNGSNWKVGLFSSVDLKNWTAVSTVAKISPNTTDWTMDGIHVTGVIPHPTENKYFGIGYGQSSAGFFRIGWVKFDENMENVEYSANELIDTTGTVSGIYGPSIVYFNGKYRIFACKRYTLPNFVMAEYSSDLPEGPYTFERLSIEPILDITTSYRGYTTEMFPFVLNSELFALVDGTGFFNESGNKTNRQFGLFKFNETTLVWDDIRNALVLSNFFYANQAYGSLYFNGHNGGFPVLFEFEGTMYFFAASTVSTDSYTTFILSKRIYYPELTRSLIATVNTIAPSISMEMYGTLEGGTTLKNGLLSVWEMNEESGTVANDSHGDKHYTHNMDINVIGKIGKCFQSTVSNKYIIGTSSDFNFAANEDFTISMWVKLGSWHYLAHLINKRTTSGTGVGYFLFYESRTGYLDNNGISRDRSLTFAMDTGATYLQVCSGPNSIPVNNADWHHVVIYRSGTKMGIKLNGGATNEYDNPAVALTLVNTNAFAIFRNSANNGGYAGSLDQTAIWGRALTETEMEDLYNSTNGLEYSEW